MLRPFSVAEFLPPYKNAQTLKMEAKTPAETSAFARSQGVMSQNT
jgi:hypothetical protein